jgi:hypothetical protein
MKIIITENQFKRLWVEQPDATKFNPPVYKPQAAPSDYLGKGGQFERETNMSDLRFAPIQKGPKKGTKLDAMMEEFRAGLFSPTGMAIEAFLSAFAFTAPAVVGAYAGMLGYDIYKSLNGDTNWLHIVFDTFCVATSGTMAKILAPYVKEAKAGFNSIAKVFEWIKTTKLWQAIKPFLNSIINGLKVVGGWIATGLKWIADNTGLTALAKWGTKIVSFLNGIVKTFAELLGELAGAVSNSARVSAGTTKAIEKGAEETVIHYGKEKLGLH